MRHKKLYLVTSVMYLFLSAFVLNAMREKRVENAAAKAANETSRQATEYNLPHIPKATHKSAEPYPVKSNKEMPAAVAEVKSNAVSAPAQADPSGLLQNIVLATNEPSVATTPVPPAAKTELLPIALPKPAGPITLPVCSGCGSSLNKTTNILCPMAEQSASAMICAVL